MRLRAARALSAATSAANAVFNRSRMRRGKARPIAPAMATATMPATSSRLYGAVSDKSRRSWPRSALSNPLRLPGAWRDPAFV